MPRLAVVLVTAVLVLIGACGGSEPSGDTGAVTHLGSLTTDPNVDPWRVGTTERRNRIGERFAHHCPPRGTIYTVWGTGVYTDDSSVCSAAVHAGLITLDGGGDVVIEIRPGQDEYPPSTAHGVSSQAWGGWGGSFVFTDG